MKRNVATETSNSESRSSGSGVEFLDYGRPADEQIAVAVKAAIMSMQLPPGQLISEMEVGRMFGVSRTPVRAAFAQLREEGLLVTWPSRGTFVTKLSMKSIEAAHFLREAIEINVVQLLCESELSKHSQDKISQNLSDQQDAIDARDGAQFRLLDDQFHMFLVEATGHNRIVAALNREKAILDRLRNMTSTKDVSLEALRCDHVAIFEAVQSSDLKAATDRLRGHVGLVMESLLGLIEHNRGYFDLDEISGES